MKTIRTAVVAFVLGVLSGIPALAFTPSSNGNGVSWVSESAEGWSGDAQTNGLGATLHLAGAFDQSVDTSNGAGITVYISLLDPIFPLPDTPTPTVTITSTGTPTKTVPTPTLSLTPTRTFATPSPTDTQLVTSTPTNTPTEIPLTLTPTNTCLVAEGSYDLTGDGEVDARDLAVLLTSIEAGMNLYDLNCDGITDEEDLEAFSAKWQLTP
jgi:hypothetical protein